MILNHHNYSLNSELGFIERNQRKITEVNACQTMETVIEIIILRSSVQDDEYLCGTCISVIKNVLEIIALFQIFYH